MIIEISDPENASLRVEGEIKVWRLKGEERFEGGRGRRDFKGEGEGGSRKIKKGERSRKKEWKEWVHERAKTAGLRFKDLVRKTF